MILASLSRLLGKPARLLRNPVKLLRSPVYRNGGDFRYDTVPYNHPTCAEETSRLLQEWGGRGMHPGHLDWGDMIGYGGAVFSAMKTVDQPCIDLMAAKANTSDQPIHYQPPPEVGGVLLRSTIALGFLTQDYVGVPLAFREAFTYLSLNAGRNIFSDLVPKHGFSLKRWIANFASHVKWKKMTDALMVTALAYPILSSVKQFLHGKFGVHLEYEMVAVPVSLSLLDAGVQWVTRKLRGFSPAVATLDFFRPFVGNLAASLIFWAGGLDYAQHYHYLLTCKLFNEAWSGTVEGAYQYKNKKADRLRNFTNLLSLDKYKVPDPAAAAAISLAYILSVKSLADKFFSKIMTEGQVNGIKVAPILDKITEAMFDDNRIWAVAKFIFPTENQRLYRHELVRAFQVNRGVFHQRYSAAHAKTANPFAEQGIGIAGLQYLPVTIQASLAAAAVRANVRCLIIEDRSMPKLSGSP